MTVLKNYSEIYRSSLSILDRSVKALVRMFVHLYRFTLSPYMGGQCRYYPTCSQYALDVLNNENSIFKSGFYILRRIFFCNPLGGFGYDPAPSKERSQNVC